LGNGIGDQYRKKSTILGDQDILAWQQEQKDLRIMRERREKTYLINKIPKRIKSMPFSGAEKEQILRGMSLLEIYKRRLRRQ